MSEWISVKDRLPEIDDLEVSDSVLIFYHRVCDKCLFPGHQYMAVGYYSEIEEKKEWSVNEPFIMDCLPKEHEKQIKVTHWMPLPEAPEDR